MKKIIFLFVFYSTSISAQNVGIGTETPNDNAILDIYDPKYGVIFTRIPLVTTDVPSPLSNHVPGMTTYNTTDSNSYTSNSVHEGFYYNDGNKWDYMGPNSLMIGDIKHSLYTADHDGWYLLDGRLLNSLSSVAQYNAFAIGLTSNLPTIDDKFIKTKTASESLGISAGSNSITLSQANLPNITYTTTTTTDGNHTHQYSDTYNAAKTLGLITNVIALLPLISEDVGTNDTVPAFRYSTANSGSHIHTVTVPTGGNGIPIDAKPSHIVSNVFIYLGK